MTPRSWRQLKALLVAALDQPTSARKAFVEANCKDVGLLADIVALLARADEAGLSSAEDEIITHLAHTLVPEDEGVEMAPSLRAGMLFGEYQVLRALGSGGMGTVYEAEHQPSGRRVALKTLNEKFATADARRRFMREGQLAASINHPRVVFVFGSDEVEGVPTIIMELVPGGTLRDRVEGHGPLPAAEAVDAILNVIEGLEAAHLAGILHRDVKPSNCFVDADGGVKIGDFGLSISAKSDETHLTAPGRVLGTPAFCSPEQLSGHEVDERSDIYSVGATLYYLLTGRPPLDAPDLVALLTRVRKGAAKVTVRTAAWTRARVIASGHAVSGQASRCANQLLCST